MMKYNPGEIITRNHTITCYSNRLCYHDTLHHEIAKNDLMFVVACIVRPQSYLPGDVLDLFVLTEKHVCGWINLVVIP